MWTVCSYAIQDHNTDANGCINNDDANSGCAFAIRCSYEALFAFLNDAASQARNTMGDTRAHLFLAGVSDEDIAWRRLQQFEYQTTNIDAWGLQIYRGKNFGLHQENFLKNYATATKFNAQGAEIQTIKPLAVTEYGIDAYNDPCGKSNDSVTVTKRTPP